MRAQTPRLVTTLSAAAALTCTGCYLSHEPLERELDPPASCAPVSVARCVSWAPEGEPRRISAPATVADFLQLGSAVAVGCEVLVSWAVVTDERGETTVRHVTRTLDGSGEPSGPVQQHPGLTRAASSWSGLRLAARGSRVGGVVESAGGCSFVALDARGRALGEPVEVGMDAACREIEAEADGFSFVRSSVNGGAPVELVALSDDGARRERVDMQIPAGRTWWSRTRFEGGAFLSYAFAQDLATGVYTGWLQGFDGAGAALSEEVELGENGVPVHVAQTAGGALATWTTSASGGRPVRLRPIDAFGAPRGPTRDVAAAGALYGLLIRSTPSGGALLAWHESHFDAEPRWRLRVQSVDADGVPLAPPSAVMTGTTMAEAWELLVHPSGDRALLIYGHGGDVVDAQALRCAGQQASCRPERVSPRRRLRRERNGPCLC